MSFRTADEIKSDALASIDAALNGIRTESGEPIVDLVDAFSLEAQRQQTLNEYNRRINSIAGFRVLNGDDGFKVLMADAFGVSLTRLTLGPVLGVPDDLPNDVEAIIFFDLNRFGESLGIIRQAATKAVGAMTLFTSTGAPFSLVAGALTQTQGLNPEVYETTQDLNAVSPAFDSDENSFLVTTSIQATRAGLRGNQLAERINVQNPTIAGVTRVVNKEAVQDGVPRQTNTAYLDAIEDGLAGFAIGTKEGLRKFILNVENVVDVLVVGPESPLMTRESAGAVDVYVIGAQAETTTLQTVIDTEGEDFVIPFQPVKSIDSAVGALTYTEGSGFSFLKDTADFAGSARAQDKLTWDVPATGPAATETVAVTFTFNALIRDLQLQFDDDPEVEVPATDILIKEATQIDVEVRMTVIPLSGMTQSNAELAVTDAINVLLGTKKLGEAAEFSEIVSVAQTALFNGVPAVDRVDNSEIREEPGGVFDVVNITAAKNEFVRLFGMIFIAP